MIAQPEVKVAAYFTGPVKDLKKIQELTVKQGVNGGPKTFDFSSIDYLIEAPDFAGVKGDYVNPNYRYADSIIENNCLTIRAFFDGFSPSLFFAQLAIKHGVSFEMVEKISDHSTSVVYFDKNEQVVKVLNNTDSLMNNTEFRDCAIKLSLCSPADIVLVAIILKEDSLAKELIKDFGLEFEDMSIACNKLSNFLLKKRDYDNSSAFVGLPAVGSFHSETLAECQKFTELYDEVQKNLHPKKKIIT